MSPCAALGAGALLDLHALPRGHFELVGVALVQVQHVHVGQHVRGAARLRHAVRLPDETLQERVLTRWVVPETGQSLTVNGPYETTVHTGRRNLV